MLDIKQKTKTGIIWNTLEKIFVQGISFILNLVLARLLTPHDYGLLGLLTIFLTLSSVFIDSGFSRALIQNQDRAESDFSTILFFNVAVSVVLYFVLFLCSPFIAEYFEIPELVLLQRILFFVLILQALTVVQSVKLQIAVDFKKIAFINFFAVIVSGIVGITAAYCGFGVWSLVIQAILKNIVLTVLYWQLGKWFPSTGFSYISFKKLFGFGSKLLLTGLIGTVINSINNLFIGKIYNAKSLGYYTRAEQFPELTSGTIAGALSTVTFPLLASLQNNKDDLVVIFRRLIKITSLVVFPAMLGLAVLSKVIVLVLLGEKWAITGDYLFWLSLSYIFTPLSILNLTVLNAIGRSDLFLKVDCVKIPLIFFVMAVTFPVSLKAVVIGRCASAFLYYYINAFVPGRLYGFGAFKQLACAWKGIVASVIMSLIIVCIGFIMKITLFNLVVSMVTGIIVYCMVLKLLKEEEFDFILKCIRVR